MLRSDRLRASALLVAVASLLSLAACAADSKKSPSSLCTGDDTSNCKEDNETAAGKTPSTRSSSTGSGSSTGPVSGDAPVPTSKPPSQADAGADAAADAGASDPPSGGNDPGPDCQALDACCNALDEAGYSATTCRSVVGDANEFSCYTALNAYRTAPDGEFTCP